MKTPMSSGGRDTMPAGASCPRTAWLFIILATLAASIQLRAQDAPKKSWFETVEMNGFVSSSWSYNFNTPDSRKNTLRVFDMDDNSIKVDVVELAFKKDVSALNSVGFVAHLTAGSSVPKVARA
jgi:hypothetical protein